jgi:hypothetical protein
MKSNDINRSAFDKIPRIAHLLNVLYPSKSNAAAEWKILTLKIPQRQENKFEISAKKNQIADSKCFRIISQEA